MQTLAMNWTVFSLTLAGLFLFGILYALLVRWLARQKVEGQTAYMVVGGVTVALVASMFTIGLLHTAILFAYFGACGLPMVLEYALRVHEERVADQEAAVALANEAIQDDDQAAG